ncbi:MAG: hypothetical protein VYA97_14295 [Pseudomonadota bacterium]|nr:hypothetical protein [Pseudomonadota bacterium]
MFNLEKLEAARLRAREMLGEGISVDFPLWYTHHAISLLMKKRGFDVPEDVLAFASEGRLSDSWVRDWNDPCGDISGSQVMVGMMSRLR